MRTTIAIIALLATGCASSPPAAPADQAPPPGLTGDETANAPSSQEAAPAPGVPRFERTNIGDLGVSAYLPRGFPSFEASKSEDGSDMRVGELAQGGFVFSCIAVRFKDPMEAAGDQLEELLMSYLNHLQTVFEVVDSTGYGRGHTLESDPAARGVLDYWQDSEERDIAVMGWITPTHIIVLTIGGEGEYPYFNAQQMYLRGARFTPAP